MKLIIYSMDDLAGSNIGRLIVNRYNFSSTGEYYYGSPIYKKGDVMLFGVHSSVRDLDCLPFNPTVCIVASRHMSESGTPTFTCHPTGNFGQADKGGREGTLQLTDAQYLRQSLIYLREVREKYTLKFEVSLEVTHHGPTQLPFPLLFVEVGSSRNEWSDENACNAVAEVIHGLAFNDVEAKPSAIGFGGPHYAPNFNKVSEHYALGHIMPKHAVAYLTKTMVQEMIAKTSPRPDVAVIDWKGLKGKDRDTLRDILDELGINWVKTDTLK
jgi:D-aminoacyl-tRNA deacylase